MRAIRAYSSSHKESSRARAAPPPDRRRIFRRLIRVREKTMAESVYKVVEVVGTSTESWEKAAKAAVERAAKSLRDLRVAEVVKLDLDIDNGQVRAYRA